jgi:hypothetical protein
MLNLAQLCFCSVFSFFFWAFPRFWAFPKGRAFCFIPDCKHQGMPLQSLSAEQAGLTLDLKGFENL